MSTAAPPTPTAPAPALPLRAEALAGIAYAPAAEAVDRIAAVAAALPACDDPSLLHALAAALPRQLAALAPEVSLALAELAAALAPHAPPLDAALPADLEDLPPRLRVLWLRAALRAGGASAAAARHHLAAAGEPLLLAVVHGWALDELPELSPLLAALTHAVDPRLRAAALPVLPRAVQHLALAGHEAFAALVRLADRAELAPTRAAALRQLAAAWLVGLSPQARHQREALLPAALAEPSDELAAAAVDACAALELRRPLAELLASDAPASAATRARAVAALGPLAEEDDLPAVLALAAAEPLRYGPPARRFLLEAHRRGAFLRAAELPAALALFDAHPGWTADELVRVTYLARRELLEHLRALPLDDERWLRRAAILPALAHLVPEAAAALEDLLTAAAHPGGDLRIAAALVTAAGESADFTGEAALLAHLAELPEEVIPALRAKGGPASAARLHALVFDLATPSELRDLALDALWALSRQRPALLAELAASFGPRHLDLAERRFLTARDATPATLLLGAEAHRRERAPEAQLELLAESGEVSLLPEVRRLFRELLRGYVRKALEGDFLVKRVQLPRLEQQLFHYGRLLVQADRPVRRWCAAGDERPETGRDLLLGLIVEWLAEEPSDPICVALLEMAARHSPDGPYLRALERFWRKGSVEVRRAALELLAAAPAGSHGLELSLGLLIDDETDFRLATAALTTVKNLGTTWAEPQARRALERREMAVKQAAAEALAALATAASVPPLVFWLSRHDNDSFRQSLSRALDKAAGAARVAVLIAALEALGDDSAAPRSRELLWRALAGHLRLPAVLHLARSQHPEHRLLVEACLEGKVEVGGASAEQVAAALHRARLRSPDLKADPARRLRLYGFSAEAALALLEERRAAHGPGKAAPGAQSPTTGQPRPPRDEATYVGAVRLVLPSWLGWLEAASLEAELGAAALALALDACAAGELAPRALALAERAAASASAAASANAAELLAPDRAASFLERCFPQPAPPAPPAPLTASGNAPGHRLRAATLLRGLPPSAQLGGLRRFRLLGKLGALRTSADLEAALDECRLRPAGAEEATALLLEALAIPPRAPGDLGKDGKPRRDSRDPLEPARLAAERWSRTGEAERRAWLHAALTERPLDLPAAPPPVEPTAPRPAAPSAPCSRAELEHLLALLGGADAAERARAAARLLAWPDAAAHHPRVLAAYLSGAIPLDHAQRAQLAPLLVQWPESESAEHTDRLSQLIYPLPLFQLRRFIPGWIARWQDGEHEAHKLLRAVLPDVLLPFAIARARAGHADLASLLEPHDSPAMDTLVALLEPLDAREAERLRHVPDDEPEAPSEGDPVDPIAGQSLAALVATIDEPSTERGLAVRAIHALARGFGAAAIEPLSRFALDRRPPVRSAALRALRTVAPRPHSLDVTAAVLAMETRRDVILQLMASLAHGRHAPALPALLERVLHRDPRIRRAAADSLRAWGKDALPALHHQARRARPDHRRQYEALLAELEAEARISS